MGTGKIAAQVAHAAILGAERNEVWGCVRVSKLRRIKRSQDKVCVLP